MSFFKMCGWKVLHHHVVFLINYIQNDNDLMWMLQVKVARGQKLAEGGCGCSILWKPHTYIRVVFIADLDNLHPWRGCLSGTDIFHINSFFCERSYLVSDMVPLKHLRQFSDVSFNCSNVFFWNVSMFFTLSVNNLFTNFKEKFGEKYS